MGFALLSTLRQRLKTSSDAAKSQPPTKSIPVVPEGVSTKPPTLFKLNATVLELSAALYHWATCFFVIALVLSQLLGAIWDTTTSTSHAVYGRSPVLGQYQIQGFNDVPFADRIIACVKDGEIHEPRTISSLLANEGTDAIVEDATGTSVTGYRIMLRHAPSTSDVLDSMSTSVYRDSCELIAQTLENAQAACLSLGYTDLSTDYLRVVDGLDSKRLVGLPNALPILIMPFWDNAAYARHAIPTRGGDACIFRLEDAYSGYVSDSGETPASFRGVNQSVRHERTLDWLKLSGGTWKNGWYEDATGMRRYTDVVSSAKAAPYFMMHRMFDMRTGQEVDCSTQTDCESSPMPVYWGKQFSTETRPHNINSVYIANGTQYGLFIYEAEQVRIVRSVFDWQTLVSNLSLGLVLARWVLTLVSLHMGALRGKSVWFAGGIGCLAGAQSFFILPIASLPRMNMTLAVFWTVGCYFEGEQAALAEAWFAMYPGIALFVAVYFSLLNTLAKILRRRMYDGLFAPTLLGLCLLHYYRLELVNTGWLKDIDSRIPTLVFSDQVKKMQLADYFISDLAFRMNGRVNLIFGVKLGLLAVNLLPLLLARPLPVLKRGSAAGLNGMEKALAVRAACVGGLGRPVLYLGDSKSSKSSVKSMVLAAINGVRTAKTTDKADAVADPVEPPSVEPEEKSNEIEEENSDGVASATDIQPPVGPAVLLNSYELIRLGYLVFGDQYVITFDEWDILSSMSLFRSFVHLWNHRVLVWRLRDADENGEAEKAGGRELESTEPQMWRLDDPRLLGIRMWQISACAVQC